MDIGDMYFMSSRIHSEIHQEANRLEFARRLSEKDGKFWKKLEELGPEISNYVALGSDVTTEIVGPNNGAATQFKLCSLVF